MTTLSTNEFHLTSDSSEITALVERARTLMRAAKSASTRKGYARDFRDFTEFCDARRFPSLPSTPEVVALYVAHASGHLRPATIARRLSAISAAHLAAGYADSPASTKHFIVGETWKGARRLLGVAQHAKAPLVAAHVRSLVRSCPTGLLGLRDRALILTGFAGGFRRSELAAIDLASLSFDDCGVLIHLRRSKTDQEGEGRTVALPFGAHEDTCPVMALKNWLSAALITYGAVFRGIDRHGNVSSRAINSDSIARVLKRAAARAGLETAEVAGHSLRSGLVTQGCIDGISPVAIMEVTGHRTMAMLKRYCRSAQVPASAGAAARGL